MDILYNTDVVVLIAFLCFLGVLGYFGVPGFLTKALDDRAERIRAEIDEARSLREEAQTLLASYERKQKEVAKQAEDIVTAAREEARLAADEAKAEIAASISRRLEAATDQIASAEAAAVREVKHRAVSVAVAAASEVIAGRLGEADQSRLIDAAIADVGAKLH